MGWICTKCHKTNFEDNSDTCYWCKSPRVPSQQKKQPAGGTKGKPAPRRVRTPPKQVSTGVRTQPKKQPKLRTKQVSTGLRTQPKKQPKTRTKQATKRRGVSKAAVNMSPRGPAAVGCQANRKNYTRIKVLHRADDRLLTDKTIIGWKGQGFKKGHKGFRCFGDWWAQDSILNAREFVNKLIDPSYEMSDRYNKVAKNSGSHQLANSILTPKAPTYKVKGKVAPVKRVGLSDVVASIKRVLKDRRAFWVSTSVNKECGGMAKNYKYEITLPEQLTEYELELGKDGEKNTLKRVAKRTKADVPTICFDGKAENGSDSNIIAINCGPLDDVEISFLTTIKLEWIKPLP